MRKISGFLDLLKSPLKILSQNGKLMAITATIYLIIYSISSILCMLSTYPVILDLTLKLISIASSQPGTPDFTELFASIREDTGIFLGIEAAYIILFFIISFFAQITVIIISSSYYTSHDLSPKELILKISKTWTRPLVTSLWVQLIAHGYTSFFLLPFLVPSLVLFDHRRILIAVLILLAIFFVTLYIYLSIVWMLGVVVSVVEDRDGFSALGEARELVKGKRVLGFVLNLFFILVVLVIVIFASKLSPLMPVVAGVVQTILIGVMSMFMSMVYCGYYFKCKNEMVKLGGLKYSMIPTTPPILDENLP